MIIKEIIENNGFKSRVAQILDERPGCQFWKTALHVHTESPDVNISVDPEALVNKFLENGYHMIAITNHNSTKGIREIQAAAETISVERNQKIVVLPGVEITAYDGVHILAIFSENEDINNINNMLSLMGIFNSGNEINCTVTTHKDFPGDNERIYRLIEEYNGLPIIPHFTTKNVGLWEKMSGSTRINFFTSDIFWVVEQERNKQYPDEGGKLVPLPQCFSTETRFKERFSIINPADIYRLESINDPSRATWIKMDKPRFEGLKQIKYGHRDRVSQDEPRNYRHPIIRGVFSNGKFIKSENFLLNPHLNVIIGERGTGKSILIDLIRFVFDVHIAGEYPLENRMKSIIGDDNWVALIQETNDQNLYLHIRVLSTELDMQYQSITGKEWYKIISEPTSIYQIQISEQNIEFIPTSEGFQLPEGIVPELYGQGEVQRIQNNYTTLMEIIDSSCSACNTKRDIFQLEEKLDKLVEKILDNIKKYEELQKDEEELKKKKKRLEEIEPFLNEEHIQQHMKWNKDKEKITETKEDLKRIALFLNKWEIQFSFAEKFPEIPSSLQLFDKFFVEGKKYLEAIIKSKISLESLFNQIRATFDIGYQEWEKAFKNHEEIYRELLNKTKTKSSDALIEEYNNLKKGIVNLDKKITDANKEIKNVLESSWQEFQEKLPEYDSLCNRLTRERKEYAKQVSTKHNTLRLGIRKGSNKQSYADIIYPILKKLKNKDKLLSLILDAIKPKDLVNLIQQEEFNSILEFLKKHQHEKVSADMHINITNTLLNRIRKFPDYFDIFGNRYPSNDTFYKLYYCLLRDNPVVFLKIGDPEVYEEITNLSIGEACSALLSLALMHKNIPLVIDQPEDDLDPYYVWEIIVSELIQRKATRQFIFVTHVANIPVIGDAEQIIKMTVPSKGCCTIEREGGFESMYNDLINLEGGTEAYSLRMQRYLCSIKDMKI